ncbi:MAG: lipid II flippase MurJ [Terracidiphilus sp.]
MSAGSPSIVFAATHRRILSATAAVAASGLIVKIVATLKEFVVAGVYARSDAMDAFLIAFLIPGLLINLIAESMNQALAPTLIRVRETQGQKDALELWSSSMLFVCVLLGAASLVMGVWAPAFFPLIAAHFPAAKLTLAIHLFYVLLPVVFLSGIASQSTAVLNTLEHFTLPAIAPVVMPLATLLAASFLGPRLGIWALVYASLAGAFAHAACMVALLHRHGYPFFLSWHGWSEPLREVAGQFGPVLLSSIVASAGLLVDQSMAGLLPAGSVSTLAYAGRFVGVVVTLLAGAVSSALTPFFSSMVAVRDWRQCRSILRAWTLRISLISAPLAVLLMVGSRTLVRLAFQHGSFAAHDTDVVAPVLAMYALQIPFFAASRVPYRLILALRRTDIIFVCGLLNLGMDIVLNLVLMRFFGVAGIALATSLWSIGTFFFLSIAAHRLLCAREGATG